LKNGSFWFIKKIGSGLAITHSEIKTVKTEGSGEARRRGDITPVGDRKRKGLDLHINMCDK
jgi:hypothetical protein